MTPLSELVRRPVVRRAAAWSALMTGSVVVWSFWPELAFVWALTQARCKGERVWVPLDGEGACLPPRALNRSSVDLVVPPLFAALVVGASAAFVRALALLP